MVGLLHCIWKAPLNQLPAEEAALPMEFEIENKSEVNVLTNLINNFAV